MIETDSNKVGEKSPSNYSFLFYEHPVYSSNMIYGVESNFQGEATNQQEKQETEKAIDEPIESWGWVNNVDRHL